MTIEEIQQAYNLECAKLGNLVYMQELNVEQQQKNEYEIEKIKNKLKSLNKQAQQLKQGEAVNGNENQADSQPESSSSVLTKSN